MTNTYFATALVSAHSVGVTIRADNIGKAFELAEDYLQERNPQSEVIVQAVQRISDEFTADPHTLTPNRFATSCAPSIHE